MHILSFWGDDPFEVSMNTPVWSTVHVGCVQEDPHGLVIVEGLDFATDLRGVKQNPLHKDPRLQDRSLDAGATSSVATEQSGP